MDLKAYFKRKNITVISPPTDIIELPPVGEVTLKDLILMVVNLNQTVLNLKTSIETGFTEICQDIKILIDDVAVLEQDVADIKRCPIIQKELNELKKIN